MEIPIVPSCTDETPCDPIPEVDSGKALVVLDPSTFCERELSGEGIPLQDSLGVHLATGEANNPIKLPKMQVLKEGSSFPFIMLMNKAGTMFRLNPNQTGERFIITTKNGSFILEKLLSEPCFKNEDVCGSCEPTYIAGFKLDEVTGEICLIKLPLSVTVDFWEGSNCIKIEGSGTEEDPYIPSIIISPADGNALQCLEDGLFVAQVSS